MREEAIATCLGALHVEISGTGPAVVCWPSLMLTGSMWSEQAARLCHKFTFVVIDPPGHGRSSPLSRSFTMEECALCVKQVLDALALPDCVLFGTSWGGMVGGAFAALYPERTRGAVLLNTTASGATAFAKIACRLSAALGHKLGRIPAFMLPAVGRVFVGPTTGRTKPHVVASIRASLARVNMTSVAWALRSVVGDRRDQHALLGTVRRPVLVVAGDEDREFSVAEGRGMAAAIPGSQFQSLSHVGHSSVLEAPDRVHAVLSDFLSELPCHKWTQSS